VPELPPHRKSKRGSKMTKTNFPLGHMTQLLKFSISPIPEARPQVLLKKSDRLLDSKNND
jgi:hypothetical protein